MGGLKIASMDQEKGLSENGWFLLNGLLLKNTSGNVSLPTQTDIIEAKQNGALLSAGIGELKFSPLSVTPSLRITFDQSRLKIVFSFFVCIGGDSKELPYFAGQIANHIVSNSKVYFISNAELIDSMLDDAKINNLANISIDSYLSFKKIAQENAFLEIADDASEEMKGIPVSKDLQLPANLKADLYPYQRTGFTWLTFIAEEKCGCILADEMGLGKTLQIITLILSRIEKGEKKPFLIVAPVTLLENWKREFAKFAPTIITHIHYGPYRTGYYKNLEKYQVVISAYTTIVNDLSVLKNIEWSAVVLDEAQNIKNPYAERTKAVKELNRACGICVTGTPFENHMLDLWSLVDFSNPGLLGSQTSYEATITDDTLGARQVEPILTPIMLRRNVADVAKDLPELIDVPEPLRMSDQEAQTYEEIRQQTIKEYGGKNVTLPVLSKLRMCCAHPLLLDAAFSQDPASTSIKYLRLCEIISHIVERNEKAIIFTSYVKMIQILCKDLHTRFTIPTDSIYGAVPADERQAIIDKFSNIQGSAVLVLNPNAAGTGLNITAANHIIHYTLEWNPAVEDQATARAYRRGQKKTVFVHRLFYADTVEEFVNKKIENKRMISEEAVVGTDGTEQSVNDIVAALNASPVDKGETNGIK
jgi:SNF2 family DNA or RNA helicase